MQLEDLDLRALTASHPRRETITEIYSESTADVIRARADRYLRQGYYLQFSDGHREHLVEEIEFDSTQSGSDCYTFHQDGNRVLVHRYIAVTAGDSSDRIVERRPLRSVYRAL